MKFLKFLLIPILLLAIYIIANVVSPDKSIEYTIISILFTAVIWLGQSVFTLKVDEGSFKSEVSSLKEEKSELKQKISKLEENNIRLREQVSEKAHRKSLLSNYPPDAKATIRREKATGRPVCNICIQREEPIISFLEEFGNYWFCRKCDKPYS